MLSVILHPTGNTYAEDTPQLFSAVTLSDGVMPHESTSYELHNGGLVHPEVVATPDAVQLNSVAPVDTTEYCTPEAPGQMLLSPPVATDGVAGAPVTLIDVVDVLQANCPVTCMIPDVKPAPKFTLIELLLLVPVAPDGNVHE